MIVADGRKVMSAIAFEASGLRVASLHPDLDGEAASEFGQRCADYTLMITGEPPKPNGGAEFFADMPDGKTPDDMLKLGARDSTGKLVGLIDMARDYPQPGIWYLGLLLIDPALRNRGIGAALAQALQQHAAESGATRMMLSVVKENTRALKFWRAQGFEVERELPARRFGTKDHPRFELTIGLAADNVGQR
jgi:ribosomal protein S18 acetylase RimI-like enzyme